MLALSTHAKLRELAKEDLASPAGPAKQAELGDRWWTQARTLAGLPKTMVRAHAVWWYQKALPGLVGLEKARVRKRIEQHLAEGHSRKGASRNRPAELKATGTGFEVTPLANGERAFSNRRYLWAKVPKTLNGWSFTRTAGNRHPELSARVLAAGFVFVAVGAEANASSELARRGWSLVKDMTFEYAVKGGTEMRVWRKYARAGTVRLPQYGFTGTILLIPPKTD